MKELSIKSYSTFSLKLIACITMLIDHCGVCYEYIATAHNCLSMPVLLILRGIGRLAFPIFCFLLVQGFFHTRRLSSYMLRLFIFAIISELPFDYMVAQSFFSLKQCSVYVTLLLGLICVAILDFCRKRSFADGRVRLTKNNFLTILVCLLAITIITVISCYINCDYSISGIFLILIFYIFKYDQEKLFLFTVLNFILFRSTLELAGLLAFYFIFHYNHQKGYSDNRLIQLGFYLFYPVHITIICLLMYFFA